MFDSRLSKNCIGNDGAKISRAFEGEQNFVSIVVSLYANSIPASLIVKRQPIIILGSHQMRSVLMGQDP